jgi:hypothetical protein
MVHDQSYDELLQKVRWLLLDLTYELTAQRLLWTLRRYKTNLRLKGGFNPDQPRDDGGRWTDVGGYPDSSDAEGEPSLILIGGSGAASGYPVSILQEDALGGHTFERHVGKPEEYLKARILGSRTNIAGMFTYGERRAGSFTSLEAANKLVNSTLAQNGDKLDAFTAGQFPSSLPFMFLFANFDTPTGYEAYAPNDRAQPRVQSTYGVTVFVRRTAASDKGYYVHSAWPNNED